MPCTDLLAGGFRPGSYRFIATTQHGAAVAPFTITDRNATVTLSLVPNGDVVGRVVMASGDPPPPRQPAMQSLGAGARILPDAKGNFTITGVQCIAAPLPAQMDERYYIKELRVNGVPAPHDQIPLCAGSRLEIVLDDKMATLAISVKKRRQGRERSNNLPGAMAGILVDRIPEPKPAKSGAVQITQLPPGDYRVLAVRQVALPDGHDLNTVVRQLWDRATTIKLAAGDAKTFPCR